MKPIPKPKRIRLTNHHYRKLAAQVLQRDNHTCQHCGCHTNSPPHHVVHRSQGGDDSFENLITLCWRCHRGVHDGLIEMDGRPHLQALKQAVYNVQRFGGTDGR